MSQFTARRQQTFLEALARTGVVLSACKQAGISRGTAYNHRNSDPEFAARWDEADESFTDVLEAKAHQLALNEGKETSLWNLLRSRRSEKYRDTTNQNVNINGGKPIAFIQRADGGDAPDADALPPEHGPI